jgi:hypothetical protein
VASNADPSTIAASTTWPFPEDRASCSAHASPAEIPDQVERGQGSLAAALHRAEHSRDRDVVDVMTRHHRHRAVLAVTGHAAVDEPRVAGEQFIRPEAEPLHDTGPESLDQRVGGVDEPQHEASILVALEVDRDQRSPAVHDVRGADDEARVARGLRALEAQDVRAHVGQHHRGERAGADAPDLDDLESLKWACHGLKVAPVWHIRASPASRAGSFSLSRGGSNTTG